MSRALFALHLSVLVIVITLSACQARVEARFQSRPAEPCEIAVTIDGKRECLEEQQ